MNMLMLLVAEIALNLAISVALIIILKPLLRDVLAETCGTEKRAEFWVTFTQSMLVISPLLMVVYFAPIETTKEIKLAGELQQTLFRSLLGNFIALSAIGRVIGKSIRTPYSPASSNTPHKAK